MRELSFPRWFHAMLCGLLLLPLCGCEDEDTNTGEVAGYESVERDATKPPVGEAAAVVTVADLTVSPTTVTLNGDGDMASFTASGGTSPYSWSVTDVFRGSVVDAGGSSAAYQRSAAGDNTVIVQDSRGKKAYAVVTQP